MKFFASFTSSNPIRPSHTAYNKAGSLSASNKGLYLKLKASSDGLNAAVVCIVMPVLRRQTFFLNVFLPRKLEISFEGVCY